MTARTRRLGVRPASGGICSSASKEGKETILRNALERRTAALAMVFLAACSGNGSQLAPASGNNVESMNQRHSADRTGAASSVFAQNRGAIRKVTEPYPSSMLIGLGGDEASGDFTPRAASYVSQFFGPWVSEYLKNNVGNSGALCRIAVPVAGVNGIGVDFANNLWVPIGTGTGSGYTTEYAPNCGASELTITDTDGQPSNAAFDPGGNVYIENITGKGGEGTGATIDVYPPGKTSPSAVLSEPKAMFGIGEALDSKGNVYMSWVDGKGAGRVDKFAGGKSPAATLPLKTGFVGGIAFDWKRNLILVNQTDSSLEVYAPPYSGSALATTPLVGASISCKLDRFDVHLFCADYQNGAIDVYKYSASDPAATTYEYSWTNGINSALETTGVAIAPAADN